MILVIGRTIEYLRKSKGLSIGDVCGNEISRQTYYRIVHNQIDTSISKFEIILKNLNISFDEFFFICNDFNQNKIFTDLKKLKMYFEAHNLKAIETLKNEYCILKNQSPKNLHMFCLICILSDRLTNSNHSEQQAILKQYLINVESWTHYEIVLFNNCMFLFSNDFITSVLDKTLHNLSNYSSLRVYGDEAFRLMINVLMLFIHRNELDKAENIIKKLQQYHLKDDLILEKLYLVFFRNLLKTIKNHSADFSGCQYVISTLKYLGSNDLGQMLKTFLDQIKVEYK